MTPEVTYAILEAGHAIQCLRCNYVSHHPTDVAQLYCGRCHRFHGHAVFDPATMFVCPGCKGVFLKTRPDNEMLEEFRRNFPAARPEERECVCEECYAAFMARWN